MAIKYKWGKISKSEWSKRFPFALVANVHALPRALRIVGVGFAGDRITVITLDGFQHFLFSVGGLAFHHGRRHQHTQSTVLNYDLDRQATNIFTVRHQDRRLIALLRAGDFDIAHTLPAKHLASEDLAAVGVRHRIRAFDDIGHMVEPHQVKQTIREPRIRRDFNTSADMPRIGHRKQRRDNVFLFHPCHRPTWL